MEAKTASELGQAPQLHGEQRPSFRVLLTFLVIAFAGSLSVAIAFRLSGQQWEGGIARATAVIYTLPLVIAALIAQGVVLRKPILSDFGLRRPTLRWIGIAWVMPLLWLGLLVVLAHLLDGASLVWDREELIVHFGEQVHASSRESFAQFVRTAFLHPFALQIAWGLFAGITLSALSSLIDEMVWRGFLLSYCSEHYRPSFAIVCVCVVSALWYMPLVFLGHLYNAPGDLYSLALCFLWFFCFGLVAAALRLRSTSVFPVAIFRGTLFSLSTFPSFALRDLDLFYGGAFGWAGIGALFLIALGMGLSGPRRLGAGKSDEVFKAARASVVFIF